MGNLESRMSNMHLEDSEKEQLDRELEQYHNNRRSNLGQSQGHVDGNLSYQFSKLNLNDKNTIRTSGHSATPMGGKSQKYKNRKHKTKKHKSRKHKLRKYKSKKY